MKSLLATLAALQLAAALPPIKPIPPPLRADDEGLSKRQVASFSQYIDPAQPKLGNFSQRYWWDSTYWKGPGSPVVAFTPGELAADGYTGYLTNQALTGAIAQAIGGAIVMIEHRNWGASLPYPTQDTKHLQQHTLRNAITDFVTLAREAQLGFDTNHSSNAPQAPWVWVGGSYGGALSAWMEKLSPGTMWAYHASSAPVEAVYDYWGYYLPIQNGMAKNCSADMQKIVSYVDSVLEGGNATAISSLKQKFGLQGVQHNDDFASALAGPIASWQDLQFFESFMQFFDMCDAIEGVSAGSTKVPSAEGVGLPQALNNYAKWFKASYLPGSCSSYGYAEWQDPLSVGCYDTYNASSPIYTDWTPGNPTDRQWYWMTCNEPFFYWPGGAPANQPSIVSRLVTADYIQRQCALWFPPEGEYSFGSAEGKTAETFNAQTDGWMLTNTTRLLWVNGEHDPWRSASVSSELRPGGPLQSRPEAPVFVIPNGIHCSDLLTLNAESNAGVMKVVKGVIAQMETWVAEFYEGKPGLH